MWQMGAIIVEYSLSAAKSLETVRFGFVGMLAAQPTITHFVPRFPTNGRRILQSIAIRQTENRRFSCRDKDLRAVAHLCSSARRDSNGLGCHVNVIPEVCDSTSLEIGCPGRLAPRSSGGGTDPARRMSRRLPGTRPANPEGAASEKARGPRMRAVDRMKWSGPVGRILSAVAGGTVIPLGRRLPDGSSHLPARSGGRPAPAWTAGSRAYSMLLRMGFGLPLPSPATR